MSEETAKADHEYHSTPADKRRARILGVVYILLAVFLAWMLFKIWPPTPWPFVNTEQATALSACECSSPATEATAQTSSRPSPTTSLTPTPTPTATPTQQPTQGVTGANPGAQTSATRGPATPTPTPTPTPQASPTPSDTLAAIPISFFWGWWCYRTSFDERLIMLVIVAGMLGSFVHGATSLADYIGNNKFNKRWTWFYLLRPSIGMALALVFYFVIRGGFLTTTGGAKDINPYGIAALAGLVGMFSKQATDKLSEVFGTLFRAADGQGDDARTGSLTPKEEPGDGDAAAPVAIALISPNSGPAAGGTKVTITGTGFAVGPPQPSVDFGEASATITEMDATKIVVTTPPNAAGAVDVFVTNADATQAVKAAGYTYE